MRRHRFEFATTCIFLIATACGPGEKDERVIVINATPNNMTPNGMPNNGTPMSEQDRAIIDGFTAPADAHGAAEGALSLTLEAVVQASIQGSAGQTLVTTGTLTQSGQQFTYSPSPADRLVVAWAEGPATEIYVQQLDGNFEASSTDAFFSDNHVVTARIVRDGLADFEVASAKNGGGREGAIRGTIVEGGVSYEVDLQEAGTTQSDVDVTGSTHESESAMTGTITAPGLSLNAQETFRYKLTIVDNAVENRTRTANSSWTYGGKQYALNDAVIRIATFNGYPDEFDYWIVQGTITEDGVVVGELSYEYDDVRIDIILRTASGEKVLIERFLRYQEQP